MTIQPDVDEVSIDDLLAGVKTIAEANAMIREGLAQAASTAETAIPLDSLPRLPHRG